jgi:hypothetical protein
VRLGDRRQAVGLLQPATDRERLDRAHASGREHRPPAPRREHVDRHQPDPDADRDVGHVERGPVVRDAAPQHVAVDEVDDEPVPDAIDQVAQGAAEHEREAPAEGDLRGVQTPVQRHDEDDREHAHDHEERLADLLVGALEQPPRPAPVSREHEAEPHRALQQDLGRRDALRRLQRLLGPVLGAEIGDDRDQRHQPEEHEARPSEQAGLRHRLDPALGPPEPAPLLEAPPLLAAVVVARSLG